MEEYVFGILTEPAKTMRVLKEKQPLKEVFLVVVLIQLFALMSNIGQLQASFSAFLGIKGAPSFSGAWWAGYVGLVLILSVAGWVCLAGMYSVLAGVFLHKDENRGLLCGLGMAMLPQVFWPPLKIILQEFEINLLPLFGVGLMFWVGVLQILALKEVFEINGARAFILWMAPWLVLFVIIITAILSFTGLMGVLV